MHSTFFLTRLSILILVVLVSLSSANGQTPSAALKFRQAQAFEEAGELDRAQALYRELLEGEPGNIVYLDGLQRTLLQLKRYDDLIAVMKTRIAQAPGDIGNRASLGSVYHKAGREEEANRVWQQILDDNPTDQLRYRMVAAVMVENRLLDRAGETYRRAREACNSPDLFTVELAQLLLSSMDYTGATEEYVRWLRRSPGQLAFVESRLATFTWKDEGRRAAIEVVRTALDDDDDVRLRELLGWLYLEGMQFDAAYRIYRSIDRDTRAQGTALLAFADRVYREGAFTLAAQAYLDVINTPVAAAKMPAARFGYASALREIESSADSASGPLLPGRQTQGEYSAAIEEFRAIAAAYPSTEFAARAWYEIGSIQYEKYFDLDAARVSFNAARNALPLPSALRYDIAMRIGDIEVAHGDTAAASAQYLIVAAAPNALPDQGDKANFRLAEMDYFSGLFASAIERLGALSLNVKADFANDALRLHAFLQENAPVAPEALKTFAGADFMVRQRKNDEAVALLKAILERYPKAPLADDALFRLGMIEEASGQYSDALAAYVRVLSDFRDTSPLLDRAQFYVGEIYQFGLKDNAQALSAYERVLTDYPHSVLTSAARKRIRQLRGETL